MSLHNPTTQTQETWFNFVFSALPNTEENVIEFLCASELLSNKGNDAVTVCTNKIRNLTESKYFDFRRKC